MPRFREGQILDADIMNVADLNTTFSPKNHFAGSVGPTTPAGGWIWYNDAIQRVLVYNGSSVDWDEIGPKAIEAASSINMSGALTVGLDLVVTGNLAVNGTTFTANTQTVLIEDNLLIINNGEVGPGVTAGTAGIEIDRGVPDNYLFIFDETQDNFRVGTSGNTQAVATRQDTPVDTGVAFWNSSSIRFDTSTNLTFDGANLAITGTVDGVDISTHAANVNAHHNETHALNSHTGTIATTFVDDLSGVNTGDNPGVTSVGTTGTVNGITLTGGPITGTGTVTLGGTLTVPASIVTAGTFAAGEFSFQNNVGIGITPATLLHLKATSPELRVEDGGSAGQAVFRFADSTGTLGNITHFSSTHATRAGDFRFTVSGGDFEFTGGNVGIGKIPTVALDVVGAGAFSTDLTVTGGDLFLGSAHLSENSDNLFIRSDGAMVFSIDYNNDQTTRSFAWKNDADADTLMILLDTGNFGIGLTPTANMVGLSIEAGVLTIKETTTPTADTNYGKVYTKSDNKLYFQDGAGVEHEIALV